MEITLPKPLLHLGLDDLFLEEPCTDRFFALLKRNDMRTMAQTPIEVRNPTWWQYFCLKVYITVQCEGKCRGAEHNHEFHTLDADPLYYKSKQKWLIILGKDK